MALNLSHPNMINKMESKTKIAEKKSKARLQSIEKQITQQKTMKQNALQKFVQDDISKKDYDNFVQIIEEKLQHLEFEKVEIQKIMTESYSTTNFTVIKKQLNEFLQFNSLTKEMLLRFVERIEISENKDIKIFYKFTKVEGL